MLSQYLSPQLRVPPVVLNTHIHTHTRSGVHNITGYSIISLFPSVERRSQNQDKQRRPHTFGHIVQSNKNTNVCLINIKYEFVNLLYYIYIYCVYWFTGCCSFCTNKVWLTRLTSAVDRYTHSSPDSPSPLRSPSCPHTWDEWCHDYWLLIIHTHQIHVCVLPAPETAGLSLQQIRIVWNTIVV